MKIPVDKPPFCDFGMPCVGVFITSDVGSSAWLVNVGVVVNIAVVVGVLVVGLGITATSWKD